ncbi:hypothetical protein [Leclercia adecarboxylata]|nr:hypothetical protein [Leclercia adecarboxylata]NEG94386.1 hypothetical protein [Leclercia adecarboxylata]
MTIIKNLTVYGGQPADSVMRSSARLISTINDGLVDRYKPKKRSNYA